MITTVTMTGADDSIYPDNSLVPLSIEYPFVEWGILVSRKHFGAKRYPSIQWLKRLQRTKEAYPNFRLSCHLCGEYVRELCNGSDLAIQELGDLWDMFDRVQINFHGIVHEIKPGFIDLIKRYEDKEFIFQHDNVNKYITYSILTAEMNNISLASEINHISVLFDTSSGAGILPDEWPIPLQTVKCGYAGGISPENIEDQIKLIEAKVGKTPIWIDMETHIRSNNDSLFDIEKVEKCLMIAKHHISSYKMVYVKEQRVAILEKLCSNQITIEQADKELLLILSNDISAGYDGAADCFTETASSIEGNWGLGGFAATIYEEFARECWINYCKKLATY
jgi:phosphoribosylanthranilate isomerase